MYTCKGWGYLRSDLRCEDTSEKKMLLKLNIWKGIPGVHFLFAKCSICLSIWVLHKGLLKLVLLQTGFLLDGDSSILSCGPLFLNYIHRALVISYTADITVVSLDKCPVCFIKKLLACFTYLRFLWPPGIHIQSHLSHTVLSVYCVLNQLLLRR